MQSPIKIGLTYTGTEEKHNNYVNWLKGNEAIEVIKLSAEDDDPGTIKGLDAVVLSGGIDMHPKNYGSSVLDYPNAPSGFNEARDAFETAVFNKSQQLHIPVLGICRGMQLINCILGGNLQQDGGMEINLVHRNDGNDKQHAVSILPNTLLNGITKAATGYVNSAHHQAIYQLGKGLQVNAQSAEGLPEGIEWADKENRPFLLGVQWHPERMYKLGLEASPLSKNIRDHFIDEITTNKTVK